LSGVLEAIRRGYDLWGRTILAFLSGIGGGSVRDLIIGGDRLPFYYTLDYRYPLGIMSVVIVTSAVVLRFPGAAESITFKRVKLYSDIVGFAGLAIAGAIYAILADMPWFWVPALAALTCAGGGALRDVVINQEPHTFKGVIYEEVALLGGIVVLGGLLLANRYEHSSLPVGLTVAGSVVLVVVTRLVVSRFKIRYPASFGGGEASDH